MAKVVQVLASLASPPAPPAVNVNPALVHVAPPAVHLNLNPLQEALQDQSEALTGCIAEQWREHTNKGEITLHTLATGLPLRVAADLKHAIVPFCQPNVAPCDIKARDLAPFLHSCERGLQGLG